MRNIIIGLVKNQSPKSVTRDRDYYLSHLAQLLTSNGYGADFYIRHPLLDEVMTLRATKSGETVWIELDNKSPRIRSLQKLNRLSEIGENGFILLRQNYAHPCNIFGVDVISARR